MAWNLQPVEGDPFATQQSVPPPLGWKLQPVEGDPFAAPQKTTPPTSNWKFQPVEGDPFDINKQPLRGDPHAQMTPAQKGTLNEILNPEAPSTIKPAAPVIAKPTPTPAARVTSDTSKEEPNDVGWLDTTKAAAAHALSGVTQTYQTVTGQTPKPENDNIAAAQPLTWHDLKDPSLLGKKILYGVVSSSPTMAGGLLGGLAASPVAGVAGPVAPLIEAGGVWAGAAVANAVQEMGPTFAQEMQETPKDPDGAFHRAWVKTGVGSMFTGASFAAFGIAPFEGALKNLLFQGVGAQPLMTVAQSMAENATEGKPLTQDVTAGIPGAVVNTIIPGALTHGALGMLGKRGVTPAATGDTATPPGQALTPEAAALAEEEQPPSGPSNGPVGPQTPPPSTPPGRPVTPEAAPNFEPIPSVPKPEGTAPEGSPSGPAPTPPVEPRSPHPALDPMPPQEQAGIGELENIAQGKPAETPPPQPTPGAAPTGGLPLFGVRPAASAPVDIRAPSTPPHVPLHAAPDNSGGMTDLSDEDYAALMSRASHVPPVHVEGEHPEVSVKTGPGEVANEPSGPAAVLTELDARRAPDEDYKSMLSTSTKARLKPGETWRDRAVKLVESTEPETVDNAAAQAAEPTPAQAEAGNYQKGHTNIGGLNIAIETPKGGIRRGVAATGEPWETTMPAHYGYVKRTEGADGDHLDVSLGPLSDTAPDHSVFIVDQIDPENKAFDEHKGFLGFPTKEAAVAAYDASFSDGSGPSRRAAVTEMPFAQFKNWATKGDLSKPLVDTAPSEKPIPKEPTSLLPFLQQGIKINAGTATERVAQNGIKDPGGDIKAILGDHRARPGFINNTSGENLDDAGLRAYQAGYFDHRPDINELLDAIRDEHHGTKLYSMHDQDAVADYQYAKQWNADIARGGTEGREFQPTPVSQEEADYWNNLPEGQFQAGQKLPRQTETPDFKSWFGESKVRDSTGKPVVVYHGTNANEHGEAFTHFDTYASNYGLMGMGGYFTEDPGVASAYTKKGRGDTPTVYPAFLSIKNPIDMDSAADPAQWEKGFPGVSHYHEGAETNEDWYRAAEELTREEGYSRAEGAEAMQSGLMSMGHDGITHIGGGRTGDGPRHRVWIAFDPEQIKSAIGNRGTFDPDSANILEAGRRLPRPPTDATDLFGAQRTQPAIRTPDPTIRTDPRQAVMPGMEPSARQAQSARDNQGPKSNQLPPDEGLFARPATEPQPGLPLAKEPEVLAPRTSRWPTTSGAGFQDLLSEAPIHGHAAAMNWVFDKGRETGHEHIAIIDNNTGEIIHAGTNGFTDQVHFNRANGAEDTDRYTVYHNHPNDTVISGQDITMLFGTGVSHVVSVGHDGTVSSVSLSPEIANLRGADTARNAAEMLNADRLARDVSHGILGPLRESGVVSHALTDQLYQDLANRLLHAQGIINYKSTLELPDVVRAAFETELGKLGHDPGSYDRYTGAVRPEDRIASLPSAEHEGAAQGLTGGEGGGGDGAQLSSPTSGAKEPSGDARGIQESHGEPSEEGFRASLPLPVKKAIDDLKDTPTGASVRDRLTEFLAPMRLGTKEAAEQAYQFANKIRRDQFGYGALAGYIRDKFSVADRWKMGRAQAEQSVFERKLARDLDALPAAQRPAYEAATRARFDATGMGHAGLTPAQQFEVKELSRIADNTWKALQSRNMVDPTAEGWAHWMPRQLVMMMPNGTARRIVKDDSILGLFGGQGSSRGKGGRPGAPDLNPFGTNMHTDVPGFRNYEEVQDTLDAARRKFGPNVHMVDDILGLVGRLERTNASIHGHDLLESIKDYGRRTGNPSAYTGGGKLPGFTLAGNPAMWESRMKFVTDPTTGKSVAATTPDGKPVYEKVPTWIHEDFRGPVSAVFRAPPNGLEKAFMGLKALSTHFVMQSPLTHLQVELGRALPLLAGRTPVVFTLAAGRRARMSNDPRIQTLLDHGMAPITRGFIGDPATLMNEANYKPMFGAVGRSIVEARDALARGASKLPGGDFFEKVLKRPIQTLLWNRVLDLQTSIGLGMYEDRIKAGWTPEAAATAAAHLANRYAGALPPEGMSKLANTLANVFLFSRSYTGGNIGVMKDTMTGAPQHVLDHIGNTSGQAAQDAAKEWMKNKARTTFVADIVLYYALTAMIQEAAKAVYNSINGTDPQETMLEGYARRFHQATQYVADHPVKAMFLPNDIANLLPTADNEPGKEDRSRIAPLPGSPQWVYASTPAGKVGHEFLQWITDPAGTLLRKQSPFIKSANEALTGKDSFGRDITRPGEGNALSNAWQSTKHFLGSMFPTQPESQLYTALGAPGSSLWGAAPPTDKERVLAGAQFAGSLSGLYQPSRGYPLGPVAGAEAERERQIQFDVGNAMPEARRLAAAGKADEARDALLKAGEDPRKAAHTIAGMLPENQQSAMERSANIKNRNALRRGDQGVLDRSEVIRRSYGLSGSPAP